MSNNTKERITGLRYNCIDSILIHMHHSVVRSMSMLSYIPIQ